MTSPGTCGNRAELFTLGTSITHGVSVLPLWAPFVWTDVVTRWQVLMIPTQLPQGWREFSVAQLILIQSLITISQINSPSPPPGSALPQREQELGETGKHETGSFICSIHGSIFKLCAFISRENVTKTAGL